MKVLIVFVFGILGAAYSAPLINENLTNSNLYAISIQTGIATFEHICGGAIISPNWIVTAAHCVGISLLISRVVAGISNLNKTENPNEQIRTIDLYNVIVNPGFNGITNDIALIKLTEPFEFNEYVQAVDFSKVTCFAYDETNTFSGWVDEKSAIVAQENSISIMPFEDCFEKMRSIYGDNLPLQKDLHVCVTGPTSLCISDGGGPLVQDNRLIGLLSWLPGICLDSDIPAIFTNTGQFKEFIRQYVTDLS